MSIKVSIKVEEHMKKHVKYFTEKFYEEVVLNAELTPSQLFILMYLYRYRTKKESYQIYCNLNKNMSWSLIDNALNKLYILGLVKKEKKKGQRVKYYVESDLPCRSAKNVGLKTC